GADVGGATFLGGPVGESAPLRPEDACTISGKVFNRATGEPLRKAMVRLVPLRVAGSPMSMPRTYSATSDAAGKFTISNLEPGEYSLRAEHIGYVSAEYGQKHALRPGIPFT